MTPNPKERELINAYFALRAKLLWLKEHPGKTRRDYQAGMKDENSGVWEWRRAKGRQSVADEQTAWESDFPNIPYDHVSTCAAQYHLDEAALYEAWQRGRASK